MSTKVSTISLAPGCRPQLREGVRLHRDRLSGRPVLLFPEGMLLLNATAVSVLRLCDGQHRVREIVSTLAATFDDPHDLLSVDFAECLLNLWNRELLHLLSREVS